MARGAKAAIKQNQRKSKGVPKGSKKIRYQRVSNETVPTARWNGPNVHRT